MKMLKVGHEMIDLDKVVQILSGDSDTTEFSLLGSDSFNLNVDISKVKEVLKSHTPCHELDDETVIVLNKIAAITFYEDETQVTFVDGNQYSYEMDEEEQLVFEKTLGPAQELPSTDTEDDETDEDQDEEDLETIFQEENSKIKEELVNIEVTLKDFKKEFSQVEDFKQIWEQAGGESLGEKDSLEEVEKPKTSNESLAHKLTRNTSHYSKKDPVYKKEEQGTNILLFLGFFGAILACAWYYMNFV